MPLSLLLLLSVLSQGNVTFSCVEPVSIAVTFPGSQSFLLLPRPMVSALEGFSVRFQFRTWNKAGLLLTFDLSQRSGKVWLCLSDARLLLTVQKEGRAALELSAGWFLAPLCLNVFLLVPYSIWGWYKHMSYEWMNECQHVSIPELPPGSALSDGQWHSAELTSRRGRLTIAVDEKEGGIAQASPTFSVTAAHQLFFGGRNVFNNEPCASKWSELCVYSIWISVLIITVRLYRIWLDPPLCVYINSLCSLLKCVVLAVAVSKLKNIYEAANKKWVVSA